MHALAIRALIRRPTSVKRNDTCQQKPTEGRETWRDFLVSGAPSRLSISGSAPNGDRSTRWSSKVDVKSCSSISIRSWQEELEAGIARELWQREDSFQWISKEENSVTRGYWLLRLLCACVRCFCYSTPGKFYCRCGTIFTKEHAGSEAARKSLDLNKQWFDWLTIPFYNVMGNSDGLGRAPAHCHQDWQSYKVVLKATTNQFMIDLWKIQCAVRHKWKQIARTEPAWRLMSCHSRITTVLLRLRYESPWLFTQRNTWKRHDSHASQRRFTKKHSSSSAFNWFTQRMKQTEQRHETYNLHQIFLFLQWKPQNTVNNL